MNKILWLFFKNKEYICIDLNILKIDFFSIGEETVDFLCDIKND